MVSGLPFDLFENFGLVDLFKGCGEFSRGFVGVADCPRRLCGQRVHAVPDARHLLVDVVGRLGPAVREGVRLARQVLGPGDDVLDVLDELLVAEELGGGGEGLVGAGDRAADIRRLAVLDVDLAVTVRLDEGSEMKVPPAALAGREGRVSIGIGPEKIRPDGSETNTLAGTVAETAYIGVSTQYIVQTSAGSVTSASSAFREGPRRPRAAHAPARRRPTCRGVVATPIALESTSVVV